MRELAKLYLTWWKGADERESRPSGPSGTSRMWTCAVSDTSMDAKMRSLLLVAPRGSGSTCATSHGDVVSDQ